MNLDFIAKPLGDVLFFIYNTVAFHSYGLAIILFTIFIKLLLLPLTIKQYHSQVKMQQLQPQIQELKNRVKGDKEKLNQETLKLYKDNNVNPAGGCLPLLIQMPILFSLYWVIQKPLFYMFGFSNDTISTMFKNIDSAYQMKNMQDISIIRYLNDFPEKISQFADQLGGIRLPDLNFLKIFNLGLIPRFNPFGADASIYLPLLFIPIIAGLGTYLSIKLASPTTALKTAEVKNDPKANATANSMNSMNKIMPLITTFFAFQVPAGLGLYWIISSFTQIIQQVYINKFIVKKKETKEA